MVSSGLKNMRRRKREAAGGGPEEEVPVPEPEKNLTLVLQADSFVPEDEVGAGAKRSAPPNAEGDGPSKKPRVLKDKVNKEAPKKSSKPSVEDKGKSVTTSEAPLEQAKEAPGAADAEAEEPPTEDHSLTWLRDAPLDVPEVDALIFNAKDQMALSKSDINSLMMASVRRSLRNASVFRHIMTHVLPSFEETLAREHNLGEEVSAKDALLATAEKARDDALKQVEEEKEKAAAAGRETTRVEEVLKERDRTIDELQEALKKQGKESEEKEADLKKQLEVAKANLKSTAAQCVALMEKEKEHDAEKLKWDEKQTELEAEVEQVAAESFDNAVAQLSLLNPGLRTRGASMDYLVHNGRICKETQEDVFTPVDDAAIEAYLAKHDGQ